jgi:hypothetical protein
VPNRSTAVRIMRNAFLAVLPLLIVFVATSREARAQSDLAGAASSANVSAVVVSPASGSAAPTQTIQLGVFGLTNNSTNLAVAVNSVTFSFSDPGLFSSTTLSAAGASPSTAAPPAANNVYNFSVPAVIQPGQQLTFSLTVTMANTTSRIETGNVEYAGAIAAPRFASDARSLWLGFVAIGFAMLALPAGWRGRVWVVAAAIILLSAGAPGCGSTGGGGSDQPTGSSAQSVIAVAAIAVPFGTGGGATPSPVTVTGLPLNLGSITRT